MKFLTRLQAMCHDYTSLLRKVLVESQQRREWGAPWQLGMLFTSETSTSGMEF